MPSASPFAGGSRPSTVRSLTPNSSGAGGRCCTRTDRPPLPPPKPGGKHGATDRLNAPTTASAARESSTTCPDMNRRVMVTSHDGREKCKIDNPATKEGPQAGRVRIPTLVKRCRRVRNDLQARNFEERERLAGGAAARPCSPSARRGGSGRPGTLAGARPPSRTRGKDFIACCEYLVKERLHFEAPARRRGRQERGGMLHRPGRDVPPRSRFSAADDFRRLLDSASQRDHHQRSAQTSPVWHRHLAEGFDGLYAMSAYIT